MIIWETDLSNLNVKVAYNLKYITLEFKDFTGIVPAHHTGKKIEAEASVNFKNDIDAKLFYNEARQRLLHINSWHKIAGIASAEFQLTNKNGEEINRDAAKSDYIKIDVPGPGSKEGEGYDWVLIEELKEINEEDLQSIAFRVRPSANPSGNQEHVAHFYDDSATSCFIVTRNKASVSSYIIDSNVTPNDDTKSLTDKIRHTFIGMIAINSFSKFQWQQLAQGLVKQ